MMITIMKTTRMLFGGGVNVAETNNQSTEEAEKSIEYLDEEYLYHKYKNMKEHGLVLNSTLMKEMQYSIELLAILQNSNVSDALYDKIVDWLWQCSDPDVLIHMPKRATIMGQLQSRYSMDDMYPKNQECVLPSINLPIYVPVHSFVDSIFSLLTSTDLMKSEHLLFADASNPAYVPQQHPNGNYGDINTGNTYYRY